MVTFRSYEGGHSERWYKSTRDTLPDFHCEYLLLFASLVMKGFQTEQDFAQIAGAGLNYVRILLPFWAIETRGNEPFLPNVAWTYVFVFSHSTIYSRSGFRYFLKAIQWARKYGLRINLDYHALSGSQNGWNHSGKLGDINMLMGPMGLAKAQRALDHIRIIAEYISQPEYSSVVTMFGSLTNRGPRSLELHRSRHCESRSFLAPSS